MRSLRFGICDSKKRANKHLKLDELGMVAMSTMKLMCGIKRGISDTCSVLVACICYVVHSPLRPLFALPSPSASCTVRMQIWGFKVCRGRRRFWGRPLLALGSVLGVGWFVHSFRARDTAKQACVRKAWVDIISIYLPVASYACLVLPACAKRRGAH